MNKLFVLLLCILSFQTVSAQIEMFDESVKMVEEPKGLPYDSLSNMKTQKFGTSEKYKYTFDHLIGQTLMFVAILLVTKGIEVLRLVLTIR